jgi:NADH:ubiquinone oxidoreductase subunit E
MHAMNTIMVCNNRRHASRPSCAQRGGDALATWLESEIAARGLSLRITRFPCLGMCEIGPNIKVVGGEMFHQAVEADLPAILQAALDLPCYSPLKLSGEISK